MYTLPVAADIYFKTFSIPDAAIPAGLATTRGFPWLQMNERRVGMLLHNHGAGSVVFISEKEFGFADAFAIQPGDGIVNLPWPPRNLLFAWKTGTSDFRYIEMVMQPQRAGVDGQGIRSGMQNV